MKRTPICLLIFLLLLIHAATAQSSDDPTKKVISKFEITAGGGFLRGPTYYEDRNNKIAYSFGGGIAHAFSRSFELKARLLYELKGSQTESRMGVGVGQTTTEYANTITTNLHYFTLSLMPAFYLTSKKNIVVGAGGFYSILKKARITQESTDLTNNTTSTSVSYYTPDNLSDGKDAGVSAYGGYRFFLSKKTDLTVMFHYNKSLVDYDDGFNSWQRNNVYLLSATFGIFR